MYLKMAGETLNGNYESLSDDELRQQLETLKKQVEAMSKVLEERQWTENLQWNRDQINDGDLNVDNVHLHSWWGKKLEKSGVLDVIKSLRDPYKSEINGFVKNNDILGLQKYLNGKIDSGSIDKIKLERVLTGKRIWLNGGHIFEDWKFWPQTLETIKCLQDISWWNEWVEGWDNWNKEKGDEWQEKDKNYTIEKVWNKNCKVKTIKSISELPDGYKWWDPKNYDESKEDTYPTVYKIILDGKVYKFYSNWRCATPENEMKNTKDVVEKIKNPVKRIVTVIEDVINKEKPVPDATFWTFVTAVKDVFKSMWIWIYIYQTSYPSVTWWAYSKQPSYLHNPVYNPVLSMKDWSTINFDANFHDYVAEDGTFDNDKLRNRLQDLVDAVDFVSSIRWKKYTYQDLFGDKKKTLSDIAFFNKFENQELEIDSSKSYTRCWSDSMNLHLDIAWKDQKWCDKTIKYDDLKINWKYSEEALKQQLITMVTEIEKNHF